MLKVFFFTIILFLIIKYQSPIYHYTVSFPRLFSWLRNNKSNNLEDQVFWYKAEPHADFKLGSKELWDYHNQNYISSGNTIKRDEEKEWDPNLFSSKKNKPSINVHKYNDMF